MLRFQFRREDAGQAANILGGEKIAFHEPLDAELFPPILIAHAGGNFGLQVKAEPLFRAAGNIVKVTADGPKEAGGAHKQMVFMLGEDIGRHHVFQRRCGIRVHVFDDPEQGLQVAQTAFAFFHIRFDQITGIALSGMPIVALFQLVSNKFSIAADDGLAIEQVPGLLRQIAIAKQVARVQQTGLDGHIFLGETDTFLRRSKGVADFQAHIPEGVEHEFYDALRMRAGLVGTNEQQIDVRRRCQNRAAISAGCKYGETLALGGIAGAEHVRCGEIIQGMQHFILHR